MEKFITAAQVIKELKKHTNSKNIEGMKRFGIKTDNAIGVGMVPLKELAKEIGKNHALGLELWESEYREARHLAYLISDYKQLTKKQMESWVKDFDSWDICDGTCMHLFRKSPDAFDLAFIWAKKKSEFIRRAGFTLMATLAVHEKKRADHDFLLFFPLIVEFASDERNFVKKAVNWALRQIGKRTEFLKWEALSLAYEIREQDSKAARWVANDAIRELEKKTF